MPGRAGNDASTSDIGRLTRLLKCGDEAGFREFHDRYFNRLYQFLLVVARGREEEAREVLQETLVRVARRPRVFQDEDAFWCWLKAVARNAARDGGRKRSRYTALLRNFTLGHLEERRNPSLSEEGRLSGVLKECLSELSVDERRLLEGKYLEGATVRELARDTSLTEKAVESRLSRLRSGLRARLLNKLNEP